MRETHFRRLLAAAALAAAALTAAPAAHADETPFWSWDCLHPDGTTTLDPANSVTTYTPQSDGSLAGRFTTTIEGGACQGTVTIPLSAVAGQPS